MGHGCVFHGVSRIVLVWNAFAAIATLCLLLRKTLTGVRLAEAR
jgi:hypothetical protein